jgi:hypothetical protein
MCVCELASLHASNQSQAHIGSTHLVSLDVAGGTTKHAVYDLKGEEGLVALYLAFFG